VVILLVGFRIESRHSSGFTLLTFASIFSGEMGGREVAELQHSQKIMKKVDAAGMRQILDCRRLLYFLENSVFHEFLPAGWAFVKRYKTRSTPVNTAQNEL
jgi:hypothetical protein